MANNMAEEKALQEKRKPLFESHEQRPPEVTRELGP